MRTIVVTGVVLVGACGGTAVIDGGGDGGGGASSTTSSMTSMTTSSSMDTSTSGAGGGKPTCDQLTARFTQALADAQACDTCDNGPDPCDYFSGLELTDTCGCPAPVNFNNDVDAALNAFNEWTAAGCGPFDCGQPCGVSNDPRCEGTGPACVGACQE